MTGKPPTTIDLTWTTGLQFTVSSSSPNSTMTLDGNSTAGPSPVQALAGAFASCMAADVVHVLTKGRHPFTGLRAHLVGERAQEDPHRFVKLDLRFTVAGKVPRAAVERAISLSREKYCSVWHSMRQDIDLQVTFDIVG